MIDLASLVDEPTPRAIAAAIARLITSGELAPDDRLPTVREIALGLGVSPATVSAAWQALARAGLIVSRGRSGTFVRSAPRNWLPRRYRGLDATGEAALDLSRGTPDPELLPPLGPALARLSLAAATPSYQQKPDIPELHDLLRATWVAPVESLTVTNGALDAIDRCLGVLVRYGDRVVVENPGFPPIADLLEAYGAEPVGVELDREGVRPDALSRALRSSPAVVVLQPRAHNPTGVSMSPERAAELAALLARTRGAEDTVVIEDDHSGLISTAPDVSLAVHIPERVLHVRSFSKSHGPDLRIAALGGPRPLVDRVVARRLLGPGWTSRMMQSLLFELLTETGARDRVADARRVYHARQHAMAAALAGHGLDAAAGDGVNAWLPVADERAALVHLATAGIRVAPGAPFLTSGAGQFVRVTVGLVREDADTIAAALADAARAA